MCFTKKKKEEEKHPDNQDTEWLKVYGISLRVPVGSETETQFVELHKRLQEKLGTPVTKTQTLKHAIAVSHQFYSQKVGIH